MPFSAVGSSLHDIGGIYQRNIAALGGAVCLEGGNSLGSFSGAAFIKNSAGLDRQSDVLMVYKRYAGTRSSYQPRLFGGKGAGILAQGVVLQVNDSFFQGHVSQYGSIHLDPFSTGIINSTVFRANAAHVAGGGVSVESGATTQLTHVKCFDNTANEAGGCIYFNQRDLSSSYISSGDGPCEAVV